MIATFCVDREAYLFVVPFEILVAKLTIQFAKHFISSLIGA
jgi:hypothetical protein